LIEYNEDEVENENENENENEHENELYIYHPHGKLRIAWCQTNQLLHLLMYPNGNLYSRIDVEAVKREKRTIINNG